MTWLSGLISLLAALAKGLYSAWLGEKSTEKAGANQQAVSDLETDNVKVQKAASAEATVSRAVSTDNGLRNYESHDPNNRDNG